MLLLCGGLVPLLLCIIWLVLIRYFVAALIWITIALLNILALLVTIFFYVKGLLFLRHSPQKTSSLLLYVSNLWKNSPGP